MIFQLLVFFILTFKPVVDEGQFDVTMSSVRGGTKAAPVVTAGTGKIDTETAADAQFNLPIGLRLYAAPNGDLSGIEMGERDIANIAELQGALQGMVRDLGEDCELVIEADTTLEYQYVVQVINAMSHAGIKKINFAPARPDES
jgi:biopolymer transport protein ExbD